MHRKVLSLCFLLCSLTMGCEKTADPPPVSAPAGPVAPLPPEVAMEPGEAAKVKSQRRR